MIIDDVSTDNTCSIVEEYARSDSRIKLLKQEVNAGAYVARNRGLDEAKGIFVTIHDADDWSHPDKIATQANYLLQNEVVIGCTSQQARISSSANFTRVTGTGYFIITNTSSFMFRKEQVKEKLGYWDTVRFSADNELIRRIQITFGDESVCHLKTGPLSFQRDSDTSIVAHEHFGIQGAVFGIRKEYLEAQNYHHRSGGNLKYSSSQKNRAFPVPEPMLNGKSIDESEREHFDVIIVSDFRMPGGSVKSNIEEIKVHKSMKLKTGIIQLCRYDLGAMSEILPEVRVEIDGELVKVITFGQEVSCDLLLFRYPPILQYRQKFFPDVIASEVKVIVNQPPMSDYTENGVIRYSIEECVENIHHYTGKYATWHPIGPLIRSSLLQRHSHDLKYIDLSPQDWCNIIDVESWQIKSRKKFKNRSGRKLCIGRHSRDNFAKWPGTAEDILAAYPKRDDVEVHVLGGINSVKKIIGDIPDNWVTYDFGSVDPRSFLGCIDVFIYYSHPDWVESFGRTIIEAMAVGVPVILPEEYKPLFKESAIYASPDMAVDIAFELYNSRNSYKKQIKIAQNYINENFSYQFHKNRINEIKSIAKLREIVSEKNSENKSEKEYTDNVDSTPVGGVKKPKAIPKNSGKTVLKDLASVPEKNFTGEVNEPLSETLYSLEYGGLKYDFLWRPKCQAQDKIFVLFSGDAMRKKNNPPVFQRWSWADFFPGHVLYFSDPALYLDSKLGLAWYCGTTYQDPLEKISEIIAGIAGQLGIQEKNIILYGSSGGGFAALRLSLFFDKISVICINPQVDVTRYRLKNVEFYLKTCFGLNSREEAIDKFERRISLLPHLDELATKNVVYIQNTMDSHHYESHYCLFKEEICKSTNFSEKRFKEIIFSHQEGHGKAETQEVFDEALAFLEEWHAN